MFKTLATVAALSLAALSAQAATVTQTATPNVAVANLVGTSIDTYSSNVIDTGVGGVRRSPWEGTILNNGTGSVYSSITGTVTFSVALSNANNFVWGSPDNYNSIKFYLGTSLIDTVLGTAITPCCVSGQLNILNSLVSITALAKGGVFDSFQFTSGQPAFEFANLTATAVPLPATGLLLLGAFGGIAALRRRKSV